MPKNVTFDEIWSALMQDPEFASQPEAVREAMRPYIGAIPDVLEGSLSQPVTLQNLMQAKLDFIRHCVDNDFVAIVAAAMPEEALGLFGRDTLIDMMDGLLAQVIEMAQAITDDVAAFLDEFGVSEENVMRGSQVGFRPDILEKYESGELTIADVVVAQPMIIIKNQ